MSLRSQVPDGGCLKTTEGTYEQVFDKTGKLIASQFTAGDDSTYEDGDRSSIHPDSDDQGSHCLPISWRF
jgi:hypothetical protein